MKLYSLQAVRALAAWLVIADHALLELAGNQPGDLVTHVAWTLGSAGVYAFFVISGFIMVHISWESFGREAAATNFLRRRVIRIVPLYWLGTVVALAYHRISATHGAHDGWLELLYSLTFIPYRGADDSWTPILPQGWTLSYEMLFYAIFASGLSFPRKFALPAMGVVLGALVTFRPLLPNEAMVYLASPIVLWFLLGMGLATIWRWRGFEEPGWLARSAKFLEPLGDASYSTYLIHGLILTALLRVWAMVAGPPSIWIVPVSLVAATIAGLCTYIAVEKPILRIINNLWKRSRGFSATA